MVEPWRGFKFYKTAQENASGNAKELGVFIIFPYSYFSCLIRVLCYLKIIITETNSGVSFVTRLRSQNGLGLKWHLLCQEAVLVLFLQGLPILSALQKDEAKLKKWLREACLAKERALITGKPSAFQQTLSMWRIRQTIFCICYLGKRLVGHLPVSLTTGVHFITLLN